MPKPEPGKENTYTYAEVQEMRGLIKEELKTGVGTWSVEYDLLAEQCLQTALHAGLGIDDIK